MIVRRAAHRAAYRVACTVVGVVLGVCLTVVLGYFGILLAMSVAWLALHPVALVCWTAGAVALAVVLLAFVDTSKRS